MNMTTLLYEMAMKFTRSKVITTLLEEWEEEDENSVRKLLTAKTAHLLSQLPSLYMQIVSLF
jgi:hypothetical protein